MPIVKKEIKLDINGITQLRKGTKEPYKVKVGVINGGDWKASDDSITVAGYGYINEMGSITANIPQRSFIRSPLSLHLKDNIKKYKQKYIDLIFKKHKIKEAYDLLGVNCKGIILQAFSDANGGAWAPNSPITIERKGSSRPLIDTGRLRKSIDFKTVKDINE